MAVIRSEDLNISQLKRSVGSIVLDHNLVASDFNGVTIVINTWNIVHDSLCCHIWENTASLISNPDFGKSESVTTAVCSVSDLN